VFASRAEARDVEVAAAAAASGAAGQGALEQGPADQSSRWARVARDMYAADGDLAGWDSDGEQREETEEERFIRVGRSCRSRCGWVAGRLGPDEGQLACCC
jgi:hypothetical protein